MDVTLRPMTEAEFAAWRAPAVAAYAADLAAATGRPLEAMAVRAEEQFRELMPEGAATPRTSVCVVVADDGAEVGTVWLGPHPERPDVAFVFDIEIAEAHRRRGFGRAAMLAAEQLVRAQGFVEIGLNVFGFNEAAQTLYSSIGYRVLATQMVKSLQ